VEFVLDDLVDLEVEFLDFLLVAGGFEVVVGTLDFEHFLLFLHDFEFVHFGLQSFGLALEAGALGRLLLQGGGGRVVDQSEFLQFLVGCILLRQDVPLARFGLLEFLVFRGEQRAQLSEFGVFIPFVGFVEL